MLPDNRDGGLNEGSSSQLYAQLLQLQKESLKEIQACTRFKPLTSVIPVHRSTNRANKPPTNHLLSERQGKMIRCKERHRSHTGVEATFEVATICVDPLCIVIHRPQY